MSARKKAPRKKAARKKAAKRSVKCGPKSVASMADADDDAEPPQSKRTGLVVMSKGRGRPSSYTPEIADEIIESLSSGNSLLKTCKYNDRLPNELTVRRWVLGIGIPDEYYVSFRTKYEDARMLQADHIFEDIEELTDTVSTIDAVNVSKAKLQVDARKWTLARMSRSKYGERTDHNIGGQSGNPVETAPAVPNVSDMTPEQQALWRKFARTLIS